jgi:2-amino-4-hydroxy-6-hydroxymethyldihydropteridine diphosphokinase/dihydropteroate synthase
VTIYLGLGSNLGDRKSNLDTAIDKLVDAGFRLKQVSPLVESPAMLPRDADPAWNKPFLNLAIAGNADWSPLEGLAIAKRIESELGREQGPKWSSRPIDIDLLIWNQERFSTDSLELPHPGIAERAFVVTPLLHIQPDLVIPGTDKSVFELSQTEPIIPLWMGIVNLTPDSFSDGDSWDDQDQLGDYLDKLIANNVQIIDLGAESTRPNAEAIDQEEEWRRLRPVLEQLHDKIADTHIRPLLSLDSRHPAVIDRALDIGIDIINDVTGLDDPDMLSLARDTNCQIIAMHAMTVPVNPKVQLPSDRPATDQLEEWIDAKANTWLDRGIDLNRIIVDPGIVFGKNSIQAYELMSNCKRMRRFGMRLLIGHSRKSFLAGITERPAGQRDLETLGISLALCAQGVDIIRVHHPFIHQRAHRAWSHIQPA